MESHTEAQTRASDPPEIATVADEAVDTRAGVHGGAAIGERTSFTYGWVLLGVSFLVMLILNGNRFVFSVFYPALTEEFGWSRGNGALIMSINILVYGLSAIMFGVAVDRWGPRRMLPAGAVIVVVALAASSQSSQLWHFYLLFGVLLSVATCAAGYPPHAVMLSNWFVRRRGLMFGVLMAGGCLAFVMTPLAEYLISSLGWRGAFLSLAAISGGIALPAVAIFPRHRPQDMGLLPDGGALRIKTGCAAEGDRQKTSTVLEPAWASSEWTLARALRNPRFWALFSCYVFVWGISWYLVVTHQVYFAVDVGFSSTFAASMSALYGVAFAVGNFAGFISDRFGREKTFTVGCMCGVAGMVLLLVLKDMPQAWIVYLYLLTFGAGLGLANPALTAAIADMFHGRSFGAIYGTIMFGFGIGGAIGSWLGGFIHDVTGSYDLAFIMALVSIVVSVALMWTAAPRKVRAVGRSPVQD